MLAQAPSNQPGTPVDSAQAISLDSLDAKSRMAVIDTFISKKKYKTAELELKKWIEQEPMNDNIQIKLATLYESKKYFQEATDIYEKLLFLNPQNKTYIKKLIGLFTQMRYYTVAIKYCERYLKIDHGQVQVLEKMAELLNLEKKYSQSIQAYQAVLGQAPHRDDIRIKMAANYSLLQDYKPVIAIYEELLQTSPANVNYQRELCFALYHNQQYQEAEKLIRDILRQNSRDYDVIDTYCLILARQQRYTEAINYYYRLLQADPLDSRVKWKIAQIYAWKGDYYIALSLYDQILRTGNVPPEILRERARVLGWAHQYGASLQQYQRILETHPQDTLTQVELQAKKAFYNHRYAHSISQYKYLINQDADNWDARLQLAQLYSSLKRWDRGRDQYQHIITVMPTFERVKTALNKLDILSRKISTDWESEYLYGKSGDDYRPGKLKMDYEIYATTLTAALPPLKDIYLAAGYSFNRHHFDRFSDKTLNKTTLSLALHKQPPLWLTGNYTLVLAPEGYDNLNLYQLQCNYRLLDLHLFRLRLGQQEFYPNADAFQAQLLQQYIGIDYLLQISSRLSTQFTFDHLNYSDSLGNRQQVVDAHVQYGTFFQRAGIAFKYGIHYTLSKYDSERERSLLYHSPDHFPETYFAVDWTEYLKGSDYIWGEDKVYYNLRNTLNLDGDVILTNTLEGLLHFDLSPQLNVRLSGVFKYSSRHLERRACLKGLYYF